MTSKGDPVTTGQTAETGADPRHVFGAERRREIQSLVQAHGRVRVRDVAIQLGVTEATVRKDIADLDRMHLLKRTHGGAIALRPLYEPAVSDRGDVNPGGKEIVAAAAMTLIADGDAIFLDSGTANAALAATLAGIGGPVNVNILTNSVDVANRVAFSGNLRHTVLGGQFRRLGGCFTGPLTVSSLEQFTLNTAFIGVSGFADNGFTVSDIGEAQVKRAAMDQARRIVVLMDQTKMGITDFVRFCDLDRVDVVVTDESNPILERMCADNEVELLVGAPDR
jgi:DeoR/GlpR family transcriptional regulator of sugar metabolism